jgi:hypothetical protein
MGADAAQAPEHISLQAREDNVTHAKYEYEYKYELMGTGFPPHTWKWHVRLAHGQRLLVLYLGFAWSGSTALMCSCFWSRDGVCVCVAVSCPFRPFDKGMILQHTQAPTLLKILGTSGSQGRRMRTV